MNVVNDRIPSGICRREVKPMKGCFGKTRTEMGQGWLRCKPAAEIAKGLEKFLQVDSNTAILQISCTVNHDARRPRRCTAASKC